MDMFVIYAVKNSKWLFVNVLLVSYIMAKDMALGHTLFDLQNEEKLQIEIDKLHKQINPFEAQSHMPYRVSEPSEEEYVIGIAVNPCGVNKTNLVRHGTLGYDCCMNRSPNLQYAWIKREVVERSSFKYPDYRLGVSDFRIEAGTNEIEYNVDIVDHHGRPIPNEYVTRPHDSKVIDDSCIDERNPHLHCIAPHVRAVKSDLLVACSDNNQTVDSTLNCFHPDGTLQNNCMQVGYSQNALIYVCNGPFKDDPECGTFLEIHRHSLADNSDERYDDVLSEIKIQDWYVNGMSTLTLSLTYKDDPGKLLCSIKSEKITTGSVVLITDKAIAKCCCPKKYNHETFRGSFFCPRKSGSKHGPFASSVISVEDHLDRTKLADQYPACPDIINDGDALYCSKNILDGNEELHRNILFREGRFFSKPCDELIYDNATLKYSSGLLEGSYDSTCPYGDAFQGCGKADEGKKCFGNDVTFSFVGEVGRVVKITDGYHGKKFDVTFNSGRTSYSFDENELELIPFKSNYDIWWVTRTRNERIVRHKKPFYISSPTCTFDIVNNKYFPYAQLDGLGQPIDIL